MLEKEVIVVLSQYIYRLVTHTWTQLNVVNKLPGKNKIPAN